MEISRVDELFLKVLGTLDEAQTRWLVGREAIARGRGGLKAMHELTGISRPTILKGMRELERGDELGLPGRIRRPGGGRKRVEAEDSGFGAALEKIMGENTAGDPMSPLRWTHKSTQAIAAELCRLGHRTSADTVGRRLRESGYSLQANAKTLEGDSPDERDAQFGHINRVVKSFLRRGEPVLSIDTKKKERVGEFKNPGRTWRPKGEPQAVNVYDFPDLGVGTAIPYGAYDVGRNEGFVNVGITHDTAEFAVESLRRWWGLFGWRHYPDAAGWLLCADGGGSNGVRNRAWKYHLQRLADELGVKISVCHYPPGTSKWNKIEHRLFSFISMNWRGEPLTRFETVVNLIGAVRTRSGLKVRARLDRRDYELGVIIPDVEMERLNLTSHTLHPKWNYTIGPRENAAEK